MRTYTTADIPAILTYAATMRRTGYPETSRAALRTARALRTK